MTHPGIAEIIQIEKDLMNLVRLAPDSPRIPMLKDMKTQWYLNNPKIKPKNVKQIESLEYLRGRSKYTIDWVNPEWEPITKIDEPWRCLYMFVLAMLALIHDIAGTRLGVLTVSWSECDPKRAFLIYDETIYHYDRETEQVVKNDAARENT